MTVLIEADTIGPFFVLVDGSIRMKIRPEMKNRFEIGRKTDLLAKSIGFKKDLKLKVLDVTAGLCRDAFHMASLGCEVTALEKNKMLYNCLRPYVKTFELIHVDAIEYMRKITDRPEAAKIEVPDVVYLDPMYAEAKRKAKPGKETLLLQALAVPPSMAEERQMLSLALAVARTRVVVKRAPLAPPLMIGLEQNERVAHSPDYSIKGKAVRFDVYIVKK